MLLVHRIAYATLFSSMLSLSVHAETFTVTSADDSGPGTLRAAIDLANTTTGADAIVFDIPANECSALGICKIASLTPLPEITEPVTIDGTTQPRYGSAPANVCATAAAPSYMRIEIAGLEGGLTPALALDRFGAAGASTFRGLALYGGSALALRTPGTHRLQCSHIGADGTGAPAPFLSSFAVLLEAGAAGAIIGTDGDGVNDLAERNLFVRVGHGVYVNTNSDNTIAGNFFGLTADGLSPQLGCAVGILIRQSSARNRVGTNEDGLSDELERNVLAGCTVGITFQTFPTSGEGNEIVGNWIGLTADGEPAGGNVGLSLTPALPPDGGMPLVTRNRIEHNTTGIEIFEAMSLDPASSENCLEDNLAGLAHHGNAAIVFEDQWWGAADGPSGIGAGSGDSIQVTGTGSVDFEPVLTTGCPVPEPGARIALGLGVLLLTRVCRSRERPDASSS